MKRYLKKFSRALVLMCVLMLVPLVAQEKGRSTDELGSIRIISSIEKAMVHIDGTKRGLTPFKVKGLSVGEHTLKIHLQGYQDYEQIFSIKTGFIFKTKGIV